MARAQSSIPSLITETERTTTIGITAELGPKGESCGMHCNMAQTKKYIFAKRTNWISNAFGRKVIILYFVVSILLSLKCL